MVDPISSPYRHHMVTHMGHRMVPIWEHPYGRNRGPIWEGVRSPMKPAENTGTKAQQNHGAKRTGALPRASTVALWACIGAVATLNASRAGHIINSIPPSSIQSIASTALWGGRQLLAHGPTWVAWASVWGGESTVIQGFALPWLRHGGSTLAILTSLWATKQNNTTPPP
eukprot:CAMPEP_0173378320 /NCGR_PEP_ID=MMETSP1356-20130122/1495_1 /TAXON_ID=77927 ORGANISM="Hemiselmis virescens, Strain PCC157" /NCGR_SAMPLE_ID=MMETSP1356 /ASSEMBLY_ACC=CAM_ASM_000847 /LENGTH=169 /DNA_ID=CAMNT_0014331347 /DNA_START=352 /DNA_END=858 /DNA_ORIENTATION=+